MELKDIRTRDIPGDLMSRYILEYNSIYDKLKEELSGAVKFIMGEDVDPGTYIEMRLGQNIPLPAYVRQRYFYDKKAEESDPDDSMGRAMSPQQFYELGKEWTKALSCIDFLKDPKSYIQDLRETADVLNDLRSMEEFLTAAIKDEDFEYAAKLRNEIADARLKLGIKGKEAEL